MIRSRAELAAHLMRAARGAGLPLALAEDLYASAGFLSPDAVRWIAQDLSEGGTELVALLSALDHVECGGEDQSLPDPAAAFAAARGWRLQDGRKAGKPDLPPGGPIAICDDVWATLDQFAARTYVPDSDLSRAKGAGAGAIDND